MQTYTFFPLKTNLCALIASFLPSAVNSKLIKSWMKMFSKKRIFRYLHVIILAFFHFSKFISFLSWASKLLGAFFWIWVGIFFSLFFRVALLFSFFFIRRWWSHFKFTLIKPSLKLSHSDFFLCWTQIYMDPDNLTNLHCKWWRNSRESIP